MATTTGREQILFELKLSFETIGLKLKGLSREIQIAEHLFEF